MIDTISAILDRLEFPEPYEITWPDGSVYRHGDAPPAFTAHFKTDQALLNCMRNPSVGMGEAYMAEQIDLDGDIQQFCRLGFELKGGLIKPSLVESATIMWGYICLLYKSPSPRDQRESRMPSSAYKHKNNRTVR